MAKVKNSCPKSWHNIQKNLPTVIIWCEFTNLYWNLVQKCEKNTILVVTFDSPKSIFLIFDHNSDCWEGVGREMQGSSEGQGRGKYILHAVSLNDTTFSDFWCQK